MFETARRIAEPAHSSEQMFLVQAVRGRSKGRYVALRQRAVSIPGGGAQNRRRNFRVRRAPVRQPLVRQFLGLRCKLSIGPSHGRIRHQFRREAAASFGFARVWRPAQGVGSRLEIALDEALEIGPESRRQLRVRRDGKRQRTGDYVPRSILVERATKLRASLAGILPALPEPVHCRSSPAVRARLIRVRRAPPVWISVRRGTPRGGIPWHLRSLRATRGTKPPLPVAIPYAAR